MNSLNIIELLLHGYERRCKAKAYYNMNQTKQKPTEDINGYSDKMKERKKHTWHHKHRHHYYLCHQTLKRKTIRSINSAGAATITSTASRAQILCKNANQRLIFKALPMVLYLLHSSFDEKEEMSLELKSIMLSEAFILRRPQ